MDIYNESLRDLLGQEQDLKDLRIRESPKRKIFVEGLTAHLITNYEEYENLRAEGTQKRLI